MSSMSLESHEGSQKEGTRGTRKQSRDLSPTVSFELEERELKNLEGKILKIPLVERRLNRLAKAGADRKQVLQLLALAVFGDPEHWRRVVKQKRDALKSLARRLRRVTEDAELLAQDPLFGAQFWLALLGMMRWEEVQWPAKSDPKAPFGNMMRNLAKHAENKATNLGEVLREGAMHERNGAIVALSHYIRQTTGRYHDDQVARLLTDAHDAVDVTKDFNAPQIKKSRQRHLRPTLGTLLARVTRGTFRSPPFSTPPFSTPPSPLALPSTLKIGR